MLLSGMKAPSTAETEKVLPCARNLWMSVVFVLVALLFVIFAARTSWPRLFISLHVRLILSQFFLRVPPVPVRTPQSLLAPTATRCEQDLARSLDVCVYMSVLTSHIGYPQVSCQKKGHNMSVFYVRISVRIHRSQWSTCQNTYHKRCRSVCQIVSWDTHESICRPMSQSKRHHLCQSLHRNNFRLWRPTEQFFCSENPF